MNIVNPGYTKNEQGKITIGGIYRTQWVGAYGAPKTSSLFFHTPISNRFETGLNILKDDIGNNVINETTVSGDLAYISTINENSTLSMGLKVGGNFFSTNTNGFLLNDDAIGNDGAMQDVYSIFLNLGAGVFYSSDKYYVGLSTPNFLPNKQLKDTRGIKEIGVDEIHLFFTAGYVLDLTDEIKFKPAFMNKIVRNSPISLDLTSNFLFYDKFEIGVAYRLADSFSGMVNYKITPQLRAGYAYDRTISKLGPFNSGSHEIFVIFDLMPNVKKGYDKSPRFF